MSASNNLKPNKSHGEKKPSSVSSSAGKSEIVGGSVNEDDVDNVIVDLENLTPSQLFVAEQTLGGGEDDEDGASTHKINSMDPAKRAAYEKRRAESKKKHEEDAEQEEAEEELDVDQQEMDKTLLLERRDSQLTPKQIVEKDIVLYDMLLGHESLMNMPPEDGKMHVELTGRGRKVPGDEEGEEQEDGQDIRERISDEYEDEQEELDPEEESDEEEEFDQTIRGDDDILGLIGDGDEDDIQFLLKPGSGAELQIDTILEDPGVVGLTLSDATKKFLEIDTEDTNWRDPWIWLSHKKVMLHMYIYGEQSEFYPFHDTIKRYQDFALLLGHDVKMLSGHPSFLCTTVQARNFVLNPQKIRKTFVDQKKKQEEAWDKLSSIYPRKWKSLGSEAEVNQMTYKMDRAPVVVHAYRDAELFGRKTNFKDAVFSNGSTVNYVEFVPAERDIVPMVSRLEVDAAIQVNPPKTSSSAQTGYSFRRNKIIQYEVQQPDPEIVQQHLDSPELVKFLETVMLPMENFMQQNEMMDIVRDDYKLLKAVEGHEVDFTNESIHLQEYHIYSDIRHSKGRSVTSLKFHPLLDELVIMAFAEDVTFDKKSELHSKMLMEPNFVLLWDLREPTRPILMLNAPSDVFSFMVSPSDPHVICGGCENGQVVLWDLGEHYFTIRNNILEHRKPDSSLRNSNLNFLEKLKDSSQKYVCPLLEPNAVSNMETSHKRVVTCVHWLPPHVEIGRNGTLYPNSWNNRSAQFFSVAGDGTMRLWDVRPQKVGPEDYGDDVEMGEKPAILSSMNPWQHLENNLWKCSAKYTLDDGYLSTIVTLTEAKKTDIQRASELHQMTSRTSTTDSKNTSKSELKKSSGKDISSEDRKSTTASGLIVNQVSSGKVDQTPARGLSSPRVSLLKNSSAKLPTSSGSIAVANTSNKDVTPSLAFDAEAFKRAQESATSMKTSAGATSFLIGCETGEIVLMDWLRGSDGNVNPDAVNSKICQTLYTRTEHDGAITSVSRSPFFHDLILVVGGGSVSVWKEMSPHPIVSCLGDETFAWCGCWSNTRPGVFFVGTREGSLQVWDLTERSHAPVVVQQVTAARITAIATPKVMTQKKHFLGIGDSLGNLFVLLIPRFYHTQRSNETTTISELITREERRMHDWLLNTETRQEQIKNIQQEIAVRRTKKTDEEKHSEEVEAESRLREEYQKFLEFQERIVTKLKKDEPKLPTHEVDIDKELGQLMQQAEEIERRKKLMEAGDYEDDEDDEEE